ncbi:MAG: hypothetical protein ACYDEQ_09675, partial [Desulfocucumaceae bacterium]
ENTAPPEEINNLPLEYRQAGEAITVNGISLLAAPGGKAAYTDRLVIGKNTIIAEAGNIFMVIPLVAPENFSTPSQSQWHISGSASNNNLLKTVENDPAGLGEITGIAQGNRLLYLIFKVPKSQTENYLVYTSDSATAAWKMPPPSKTAN